MLALDVPVPQMENQLVEVCRELDSPIPELAIEVPKISSPCRPCRRRVRFAEQTAEQLVEVPTIISYSSLQRTVEQHVDIPVPGGGGRYPGLQGLLAGQSSTASQLALDRLSERIVEQIVDPVSSGRLQGSSSSHFPAGDEERADEPGKRGFSHFSPNLKKVRWLLRTRGRNCLPELSPSTRAAHLEDSVEGVRLRDDNSSKPYHWNRRTRASAWKPPPGAKVVWIGERKEEGVVWYWHRDTRVSRFDLPPLPPG